MYIKINLFIFSKAQLYEEAFIGDLPNNLLVRSLALSDALN